MSDFKGFLKKNVLVAKNKHVAISSRMLDDKGKPILWELRPIDEKENKAIKNECTTRNSGRAARAKGETINFDGVKFTRTFVARSVVYPDLNNAELQASYGVVGAENLLEEMLLAEEYAILQIEADDFGGDLSRNIDSDIDEVKNSSGTATSTPSTPITSGTD